MRKVQWRDYNKAWIVFGIVTVLINLLMSTYLVENIETNITNGTLESLEIQHQEDGTVVAETEGLNLGVYDTYQLAMMYGDTNRFLIANNGIVFKSEVFNIIYYYVLDFSWLPSGKYNHSEVVDYIQTHKLKQILRTGYLSNGLLIILFLYPIWLLIGIYLMPLLLIVVSWVYTRLRILDSYGEDKEEVIRLRKLTRSQYLQRMVERYNNSQDLAIMTGIFCIYLGTSVGYFTDITSILTSLVVGYSFICLLLAVNYGTLEYLNLDSERLDELKNKK